MPDPKRDFTSYATSLPARRSDMAVAANETAFVNAIPVGFEYYNTADNGPYVRGASAYFYPKAAANGWE